MRAGADKGVKNGAGMDALEEAINSENAEDVVEALTEPVLQPGTDMLSYCMTKTFRTLSKAKCYLVPDSYRVLPSFT